MNDATAHELTASISRTVEWVDTDASGHQHNSAIIRWVESAEAELFRRLGLPDYFPSAPRVQQTITFRSKLWFGQPITAILSLQKLGRTSMTFGFKVYGDPWAQSSGGLAADGVFTTAFVPAGAERALPWPDHMRSAIEQHRASA